MNRIDQLQKIIDERFGGNKNAFARAIGKTPTHIYQWLNGIRNITDKTAQHIETALNLPSNYLFSNKKQSHTKKDNKMAIATIPEILADIKAGKMVIITDDEDRENEGDLLMAAQFVTPDAINFMIKYARGLVCLPMTNDMADKLNLPLMTQMNGAQFGTNFTVSIEAATGISTGISAADRAHTILTAVSPPSTGERFGATWAYFSVACQKRRRFDACRTHRSRCRFGNDGRFNSCSGDLRDYQR